MLELGDFLVRDRGVDLWLVLAVRNRRRVGNAGAEREYDRCPDATAERLCEFLPNESISTPPPRLLAQYPKQISSESTEPEFRSFKAFQPWVGVRTPGAISAVVPQK